MKSFARYCMLLISSALLSLLLLSAASAAEPPCVPLARKIYAETNALVSSGKTRVIDVTFPWFSAPHAVVRTTRIKYYYTETTELDEYGFPATTLLLRKAVVTHQFSKEKPMETDEYYYNDGSLLFFYMTADVTEENLNQHIENRYYYDGGEAVRAIVDTKALNDKSAKPVMTLYDGDFSQEMAEHAAGVFQKAERFAEVFSTLDDIKGFN